MLSAVYQWRLLYIKQHVPAEILNLSLEPFVTWPRILNADEMCMAFVPEDDCATERYTILCCTSADGDVKMPMIVFDGTTQLTNPISLVNGRPIFEAYNNTHYNNALLHGEYLQALYPTLSPCSCKGPGGIRVNK